MRRTSVGHVSMVLLAVYLVCTCLVFSFILFEVLDIDGSDFPVSAPTATATLTHSAEHDIKKTQLVAAAQPILDLGPPAIDTGVASRAQQATWLLARISGSPGALAYRIVLARSSLSDGPASA